MAENRLGGKLRRLRQDNQLTQAQMAQQLEISASYLNLLEHNQRPVTVPVLLKLAQKFSIDIELFNTDNDARLLADLMEAFADPLFDSHDIKAADLKDLVGVSPALARSLLTLYQANRGTRLPSRPPPSGDEEDTDDLDEGEEVLDLPTGMPSEEVSDFIHQRGNYFHSLEVAAETLWRENEFSSDGLYQGLVTLLARRYAIDVVVLPASAMNGMVREYQTLTRRLHISEMLPPSSRCFQLAHQIARLGYRTEIEKIVSGGKFTTIEADQLARTALANAFAAAIMMPYERFREAAQNARHDVDILQNRFGASFEQVCHRLTALRRPGAEGIPFHLIRVDIAGNISKRYNGSGIRIARFGAACPRWNVFDAFGTPGIVRVQMSEMPDGSTFFCIARTTTPAGRPATLGTFGSRVSQLSIGLGCTLANAKNIVYADALALDNRASLTPIGVSCRICERTDCADRAMPSLHHKLEVDENRRGLSTYSRIS